MHRKPALLLLCMPALLLSVFAPVLPAGRGAESWPDETLIVSRNDGLVVYSMATGRERFRLPPGILAQGHYVTLEPNIMPAAWEAFHHDESVLKVLDPFTSFIENSLILQGQWVVGGASSSARWLALTRVQRWTTDVQVIDTSYGEPPYVFTLDGAFEVVTISPDGQWLYLVERLPTQPGRAVLRRLDLRARVLPGADGTSQIAELSAEYFEPVGASPDGHWFVMLCVSTRRDERHDGPVAFVQALDLQSGAAVSIDLPSGVDDVRLLRQYALRFVPESDTLLAANAALGSVTHIQLGDVSNLVRSAGFPVGNYGAPTRYDPPPMGARSALSPDGARLYFTGGWDVWALDVRTDLTDGPYLIDGQISGLGLSGDGRRLYAATAAPLLHVLDASTGDELALPDRSLEP